MLIYGMLIFLIFYVFKLATYTQEATDVAKNLVVGASAATSRTRLLIHNVYNSANRTE